MMLHDIAAPSRREQAKGGRRSRIVQATCALLREVQVSHLSVKMIADQAGLSPATVYNLFGTKAAVLEKVYERDLFEFEHRVADTVSRDSLERIFDCVAITADHYRADPRFYRSIIRMPNGEHADPELIDALSRSRGHFWGDLVRTAMQDGHLGPDADPSRLGSVMNHLAAGAVACWVANLITLDRYEQDVAFGFAALLSPFATNRALQSLLPRLAPGAGPSQTHQAVSAR
jgi:AcrR family transcriptional regulator